ncbi:MAG TPA: hypothetical protein ENJ19_11540 [Gammaproteobacteria bacterium]|nr:hypothetical protein [Gammaproteobacteria bacterium]
MYRHHFGLHSDPFQLTPDTQRFFPGAMRGAILDALFYVLRSGGGFAKVSGEIGSGKTMLCRMLGERLRNQATVLYLPHPTLSPDELLRTLARELKLPLNAATLRYELLGALHDALIARHRDGQNVVVLVEESQGMPQETLEELRLLSNLETQRATLLQVVLFGQPELDLRLARSDLQAVRARIIHGFTLPPLTASEIRDYVAFRLAQAGHRGEGLFSDHALRVLSRASRGVMRRINVLAHKALLAAYADTSARVAGAHVRAARADTALGGGQGQNNRQILRLGGATMGLMALAASAYAIVSSPRPGKVALMTEPAALSVPTATPAQSTPFTQHLAVARSLLLGQPRLSGYTIQLLLSDSDDPGDMNRFLRQDEVAALSDRLLVFPTRLRQARRWALAYGRFGSLREARAALAALPPGLRRYRPYVRGLAAVQAEALRHGLGVQGKAQLRRNKPSASSPG